MTLGWFERYCEVTRPLEAERAAFWESFRQPRKCNICGRMTSRDEPGLGRPCDALVPIPPEDKP